jgi:hypothetical protein
VSSETLTKISKPRSLVRRQCRITIVKVEFDRTFEGISIAEAAKLSAIEFTSKFYYCRDLVEGVPVRVVVTDLDDKTSHALTILVKIQATWTNPREGCGDEATDS